MHLHNNFPVVWSIKNIKGFGLIEVQPGSSRSFELTAWEGNLWSIGRWWFDSGILSEINKNFYYISQIQFWIPGFHVCRAGEIVIIGYVYLTSVLEFRTKIYFSNLHLYFQMQGSGSRSGRIRNVFLGSRSGIIIQDPDPVLSFQIRIRPI